MPAERTPSLEEADAYLRLRHAEALHACGHSILGRSRDIDEDPEGPECDGTVPG